MSGIDVALSTTRHLAAFGGPPEMAEQFMRVNLPCCIARIGLGLFGSGMEELEHRMAEISKNMAKLVHVDVVKKLVFIGENPEDEETGLVWYEEKNETNYTRDFFQRWRETETLLFEFHHLDMNGGGSRFVIKGLWTGGKWEHLDIISSPKIEVLNDGSRDIAVGNGEDDH